MIRLGLSRFSRISRLLLPSDQSSARLTRLHQHDTMPFRLAQSCFASNPSHFENIPESASTVASEFLNLDMYPIGSLGSLDFQLAQTAFMLTTSNPKGNAVEESFKLFERLVVECEASDGKTLDIFYLHRLLKSWKNAMKIGQTKLLPSGVLQKVDSYCERCPSLVPNIATFSMILDGASECPIPMERITFVENLVDRLMAESTDNVKVQPTIVTMGIVVKAYARSRSVEGAKKAEEVCNRLKELSSTSGWEHLKPNAVLWSSVVDAWAKAGKPEEAQRMLEAMDKEYKITKDERVRPSSYTFNSCIAAWALSKNPDGIASALSLLRKMEELSVEQMIDDGPSTRTYNCILKAYSRRRNKIADIVAVEVLLQEMIDRSSTNSSVAPDKLSFICALNAILNSRDEQRGPRAHQVVSLMRQHGFDPNQGLVQRIAAIE